MIKFSFSSLGDPKRPLPDFVQLLADLGYDGIELRGRPGEHVHWQDDSARRAEVRRILADGGLDAAAISTYIFSAGRDAGGPGRDDTRDEPGNIEELKRWIDLAGDLGAPNVRIFGGKLTEGDTREAALERIGRIMAAGAAVNPAINICLEIHDIWTNAGEVKCILDLAGQPNAKALWDLHGSDTAHETPEHVIATLTPERIAYLHVKDWFPLAGRDRLYQCFIGAGITPIGEAVRRLKLANWAGYLNVEWEGVYNPYMPEMEVGAAQAIMKLRQYMAE